MIIPTAVMTKIRADAVYCQFATHNFSLYEHISGSLKTTCITANKPAIGNSVNNNFLFFSTYLKLRPTVSQNGNFLILLFGI
jgi:hypothetical protein